MKRVAFFLKKSVVGKILYFLRDFLRFPNGIFLLNRIKNNNKIVVLLGVPTFNNIGDHLIAMSSIKFINDIYKDYNVVEIPTQFFLNNKTKLRKIINSETPIFIVGGGWMGSIWPRDEYIMQEMIQTFSNNIIVVLPQTVFYDFSKGNSKIILDDAKKTYSSCNNITFFFRDEESYNFAMKEFNHHNIKVFFAPDIALYLNNYFSKNKKREVNCIKLCLRNDREKKVDFDIYKVLKYNLSDDFKIKYTDTITKFSIPIWIRRLVINSKVNEFKKSSLIITDRLHGMIFCALSNTKCIVFDNKTKKVSGVYNKWLSNNKNILFLDNSIDEKKFISSINYMLNKKEIDFTYITNLNINFNKMKNDITRKEGK